MTHPENVTGLEGLADSYCAICRYWDESDEEALDGKCRRHSPIVTGGMMSSVETVWPTTNRDDWCGEYRAHQQEAKDHV